MKRGGGVHTVFDVERKRWVNKLDKRVLSRHDTKEAATEAGRVAAKQLGVEHSIHRQDGAITEKNSYGNDPYPPKDGG